MGGGVRVEIRGRMIETDIGSMNIVITETKKIDAGTIKPKKQMQVIQDVHAININRSKKGSHPKKNNIECVCTDTEGVCDLRPEHEVYQRAVARLSPAIAATAVS